jgi:hypothetical protein
MKGEGMAEQDNIFEPIQNKTPPKRGFLLRRQQAVNVL